MLPAHREVFELEGGDLMVRRVGGLLGFREHGRAFDGSSAGGVNLARPFLAGHLSDDPQDLVHPVNAPVAQRAVGVVEVLTEAARVDRAAPWIRRVKTAVER